MIGFFLHPARTKIFETELKGKVDVYLIFSIKIVRIDFNMFSTVQIYFSSKVKKTCLVYSKPFIVDILRSVSQHHGIIWPFIRFRAPSFLQISFGHLYSGVNELVLPPIVISYVRLSASVYRFRNLVKKNVAFLLYVLHDTS